MRSIKKYVDHIEEEIEGDMYRANKYKDMANDELGHAMNIHEFAVKEIEQLSKVYTPPVEMLEKWEAAHKKYVQEVAWVKQMLSL